MSVIDPNRAVDLARMQQEQAKFLQAMNQEVRGIAIRTYDRLVQDYLLDLVDDGDDIDAEGSDGDSPSLPDPQRLRRLAFLALKSASYLHQCMGLCQIDEERNWLHDADWQPTGQLQDDEK